MSGCNNDVESDDSNDPQWMEMLRREAGVPTSAADSRDTEAPRRHHAPHVKRYAMRFQNDCWGMDEVPDGSYVRFEDYETLRRQYDATAEGYRAAQVALRVALSWALDMLDMADGRLVRLGDPPELVNSETHTAAKAKARAALAQGEREESERLDEAARVNLPVVTRVLLPAAAPVGSHECPSCGQWCVCAEFYDGLPCACPERNHAATQEP